MRKKIEVDFTWFDDECCQITCPNCKNPELYLNIYEDDKDNTCVCGKKFVLQQRNWVEDISD